jgi:hypothetical protein
LPVIWGRTFEYQCYQTAHWRPLVTGESGNFPAANIELSRRTAGPPTDAVLRFLELSPADTVVVHRDRYDGATAAAWETAALSVHGFRFAGAIGDALVLERTGGPAPASERLRVTRASVHPEKRWGRPRVRLTVDVRPAQLGLPWRYLTRGLPEVEVEVTEANGACRSFRQSIAVPPYLLAEESARLEVGPLSGVSGSVTRLRFHGPLLEESEVVPAP